MSIDIAYIVSHGFAARMVTQTDLLGKIVETGKKVALISPDESDANLKNYCQQRNISLHQFRIESRFWTPRYGEARKYFLEDIRSNPALWEKHIRAIKYNKSLRLWNHIRPRLLYAAYRLIFILPFIRKWYKRREKKYLKSNKAASLISKINPKVLVSTYPVNFGEAMLITAARNQGRRTFIHLLSWDNISCKGHFPSLADEYIAWGPIMKEELIEYYNINKDNIHVCGVPHFDLHLLSKKEPDAKMHLIKLGLDPSRPYLFFGMSSPRFAPKEIDIVEKLATNIDNNTFGKELQLIVRPHPQNVKGGMADKSWLPRLKSIKSNRVSVDFPDLTNSNMPWSMAQDDMKRLTQLLSSSILNLNSGSTLSIDALMCGKPVILTAFDGDHSLEYWESARRLLDYPHLKKLISFGGISICRSYDDLTSTIETYLKNPNHLINQRKLTLSNHCHLPEKSATQNVVDCFVNSKFLKT